MFKEILFYRIIKFFFLNLNLNDSCKLIVINIGCVKVKFN